MSSIKTVCKRLRDQDFGILLCFAVRNSLGLPAWYFVAPLPGPARMPVRRTVVCSCRVLSAPGNRWLHNQRSHPCQRGAFLDSGNLVPSVHEFVGGMLNLPGNTPIARRLP